ncbi:MAG TPA: hypothetical protein EYQ61_10675 [Dehalococcoidia bacterium]|jgi:hypothetical protein|nr:hypothetical protein [Dehalococcoidia bacterium]HIK89807.1 hypothetical protein [Dehalococcoidia bacterium]
MDSVRTAATAENENATLEQMKMASFMGRAWSDYPDIEIVEVKDLKFDEVLCRILYDAISHPPADSGDASFDIVDKLYFRLVDGRWLEDHTSETWRDEWDSTTGRRAANTVMLNLIQYLSPPMKRQPRALATPHQIPRFR